MFKQWIPSQEFPGWWAVQLQCGHWTLIEAYWQIEDAHCRRCNQRSDLAWERTRFLGERYRREPVSA